jgi:small Trp-rich protein
LWPGFALILNGVLQMWFVAAGVLLVVLKLLGIAPMVNWPWWWMAAPFGLAAVWWAWADASGYTQRKAMQRMDDRKSARRARTLASLGRGEAAKGKFPRNPR